jgi:hypothetical protein
MEVKRIMDTKTAFEDSLAELGIEDLDGNLVDIPDETVDETELSDFEDESLEGKGLFENEESDDDEQASEGQGQTVIEIVEGATIRLPDGTTVPAEQAVLLQADYTRKTQELAEQRKAFQARENAVKQLEQQYGQSYQQMREWYEERAENPSNWIAEIAGQSQDPTSVVASAIYGLAQQGMLDPKFVEAFGIDAREFQEAAKTHRIESEVERLKREMRERDAKEESQRSASQRQLLIEQRAAIYEQEWEQIKATKALQFNTPDDEAVAKKQLLQFALENRLSKSLVDAHDLFELRIGRTASKNGSPDPDVAAKKRASRAVTPKTSVSGQHKRANKKLSDREAILEAMEAVGL